MTTPDHDESKPRRRRPSYLTVVLWLVLIGYPLSAGPAIVIAIRLDNQAVLAAIDTFYTPLEAAADGVGAGQAIRGYAVWWCHVTNTKI